MTHGFQRPRVGTRRRLAIVASAITAALILSGAASATPPRQPLVMGISLKAGSTARTSDDLPALDAFIAATGGRPPASYSIWSDWGGANAAFPRRALLDGIVRRGATPVIFWQLNRTDSDGDSSHWRNMESWQEASTAPHADTRAS